MGKSKTISADQSGNPGKGHIAHSKIKETNNHYSGASEDLAKNMLGILKETIKYLRSVIRDKDADSGLYGYILNKLTRF